MSVESAAGAAHERFPELTGALQRHLAWTREFAIAGDLDSAMDALRDAHATSGELRAPGAHPKR